MKQMQKKLKSVDCIIEVHDSRIPFSGRNPLFYRMLTAIKPHILVLNKIDLSDMLHKSAIENQLKKTGIENIIFTNCKNQMDSGLQMVVSKAIDLIKNAEQYNRAEVYEYLIMIIGIPNVGKSSLINMLRSKHMFKGRATKVGSSPGVTKSVQERIKVSDDPLIYLLDTPGVLQPNIDNVEVGMKLALCNTLKDRLVGIDIVADYLLFWLNKHQNFSYVEFLGIPAPTDDIRILLCQTAIVLKKIVKYRTPEGSVINRPDNEAAAQYFIRAFRDGKFGRVLLDVDNIQ